MLPMLYINQLNDSYENMSTHTACITTYVTLEFNLASIFALSKLHSHLKVVDYRI